MGKKPKLKGKMHNILCFCGENDTATREAESERLGAGFSRRAKRVALENRLALIVPGSGWGETLKRGTQ
jgi:hypothetical protein